MPDANVLPDATTTDGALLVLAIVLPAAGVLLSFVLGGRYAERIASVLLPSGFFLATIIFADVWQSGQPADLHRRGLEASARDCVARRRTFGGDDGNNGDRDLRGRHLCTCGLRHACRVRRSPRTVRVLDPADGDLGRNEYGLPGRRSVHVIRRDRAPHLRRGTAGLSRRPSGDIAGRAAIPALRPARLDSLPGRNRPALRQLCNARHRPALPPGSYGTRNTCCRHADDHQDSSPRPPSFHCIYGFRQPMPARRRPPARFCRRWW